MITQLQANYTINIGLHVIILFTFLTIFFFTFVSKLESKSIQNALSDIIDEKTEQILTEIDGWEKKLNVDKLSINWEKVNDIAKQIEANSQGELPEITKQNKNLKNISIGLVVGLFVLFIIVYLFFHFGLHYQIQIGSILLENAIIFFFVGIVEYLFFMNIAAKYIPVTPEFVSTTILERIKERLAYSLLKPT